MSVESTLSNRVSRTQHEKSLPITCLVWNPKMNGELAYADDQVSAVLIILVLEFHVNFTGVQLRIYTQSLEGNNFTLYALTSKYVKFREICSLQYSIIINTFWVDPHSDLLKNAPVKPKNCYYTWSLDVSFISIDSHGDTIQSRTLLLILCKL